MAKMTQDEISTAVLAQLKQSTGFDADDLSKVRDQAMDDYFILPPDAELTGRCQGGWGGGVCLAGGVVVAGGGWVVGLLKVAMAALGRFFRRRHRIGVKEQPTEYGDAWSQHRLKDEDWDDPVEDKDEE